MKWALDKGIFFSIRFTNEFETRLIEKIIKLEEENKMPYVTSWERMAKAAGVKEGKEAGVKEEKRKIVINLLNTDFHSSFNHQS